MLPLANRPRSFVSLIGTRDKTADPELWSSGCRALREDERWLPHLSRICRITFPFYVAQRRKISRRSWGSLVTQAESRRDGSSRDDIQTVLPWLVSSRLSDILMRWDLAVSQCKCHSLSFSLPRPILSRPPSFFVPFSLRIASAIPPPEHILVLRFPLIAIPQFVWIRTYNTIRNNTEYHRNGWQWEMEIRTIVIWMKSNDMSESNTFAYNIIAQLRSFPIVQLIIYPKLTIFFYDISCITYL